MKVLVVGGGTAGLIAASILKKRFDIQVDIVHSKNIGIIGVGEGSTEHWDEYLRFMNINPYAMIKHTDATFKGGIMFEGWTPNPYLHNVSGDLDGKLAQYYYLYAASIAKGSKDLTTKSIWKNKIASWWLNKPESMPFNQYHFNTFKINDFLQEVCKSLGINIYEDDISEVVLKENGEILKLKGSKKEYSYDFYIDSTGFKRILIGKLGAKWKSYGEFLKMKSAITFASGDSENYNLYTLSKAMNYGWRFNIPVWGRHGNGYIFDSDYINADQAKKELEEEFGYEIEINKQFSFDPGRVDRAWIKNCVAVGISGSFIEPLEATSIGSTIQQVFLLMHYLIDYDDKSIERYNKKFDCIIENIFEFVFLHYLVKKNSTQFWKDIQNIKMPDDLKYKLDLWKNRIPLDGDFTEYGEYAMFGPTNYFIVLEGLGLLNKKSIKEQYLKLNVNFKELAESLLNEKNMIENQSSYINHKDFLKIIREYL